MKRPDFGATKSGHHSKKPRYSGTWPHGELSPSIPLLAVRQTKITLVCKPTKYYERQLWSSLSLYDLTTGWYFSKAVSFTFSSERDRADRTVDLPTRRPDGRAGIIEILWIFRLSTIGVPFSSPRRDWLPPGQARPSLTGRFVGHADAHG